MLQVQGSIDDLQGLMLHMSREDSMILDSIKDESDKRLALERE